MKSFKFIVIALLMGVVSSAYAQTVNVNAIDKYFQKYVEDERFTVVYISSKLLNMFGKLDIKNMEMDDAETKAIIDLASELPIVTGYAQCSEGLMREFDRGYSEVTFANIAAHTGAADAGRRAALGEATALRDWIAVAARRLAPGGHLHMIQRADRLPDMLAGCAGRLGSLEVLPLASRAGRAPGLLILRARKGGRAGFRLHAPLIVHPGVQHPGDMEHLTPEILAVQRHGAALPWPCAR